MDRFVYLDNSATTKVSERVFEAMVPYLTEHYGNPSSIYAVSYTHLDVYKRQL